MAKVDLIRKLKDHLGIPSEFVKVFTKFWGGSGMGFLSCTALKTLSFFMHTETVLLFAYINFHLCAM